VDGRVEVNETLEYKYPLHYFSFIFRVQKTFFKLKFKKQFNKKCKTELKDCLEQYINKVFVNHWKASCIIDETGRLKPVGVRNLTMHLTERRTLNKASWRLNKAMEFEMIVRMEFNELDRNMSGNFLCTTDIGLRKFAEIAKFTLWFWVSRKEFSYFGGKRNLQSIPSAKQLWGWNTEFSKVRYTYAFQEKTYDGESEFSANLDLNFEYERRDAFVTVVSYPSTAIIHYSSFSRYNYLSCLADIGGLYTLVTGFFFIFAPLLAYRSKTNRGQNAYRTLGILPAISASYRNKEELSSLRSLVLVALGITENDYFKYVGKMACKKQED